MKINNQDHLLSYDYDGVASTGNFRIISHIDIILTGRCYDEQDIVVNGLKSQGIINPVIFFNPFPYAVRGNFSVESRLNCGHHKARVLTMLCSLHKEVTHHEDDLVQIEIIQSLNLPNLNIITVPNNGEVYFVK